MPEKKFEVILNLPMFFPDRLNFVGRSGTPSDVRYFSHGEAEMPELYTQDIISGYAHIAATQQINMKEGKFYMCGELLNMCTTAYAHMFTLTHMRAHAHTHTHTHIQLHTCLLYTSDAADDC